jgi:DNA invertase Pin-like site-specific DNA recombinase
MRVAIYARVSSTNENKQDPENQLRHLRERLDAAGVKFHSYTEPMLSTDNEMIRDIVLAVMASLAKQERLRHLERIHAGISKARQCGTKSGKPIGRARVDQKIENAIRASLASGKGILKTARELKVGSGTVQRVKATMVKQG